MKKSLLLAAALACSGVAQAETYVCTNKKSSTTMHPISGLTPNYTVNTSDDADGYIVDTLRGMRAFNDKGKSKPNFGGSCDVNQSTLKCTRDWGIGDFMSVQTDLNRLMFTSSTTQGGLQMVVASVGNCIKL